MKNTILKKFSIQKKDVKADGSFAAVIATLGLVDKDGDVTKPGFFGKQGCVVVPAHDWSHVPIGKAMVHEAGDQAIAEGKINLDIEAGKAWFSAMQFDLAEGDPLMEWSYGFKVLDGGSSVGEMNGQRVRYLQPMADGAAGCKVYEVSPVLVGAGEKTRTLVAKAADGEGKRFCDEVLSVLDAAEDLVVRGKSLADLRAKDGREMSAATRERFAALADSLVKTAQEVTALAAPKQIKSSEELTREVARMLKLRAGIIE